MTPYRIFVTFLLSLTLSACATTKTVEQSQVKFFERLTSLCGKAFGGGLVSNDPADANLAGKPMIMHVASCNSTQIKIPFHVEMKPGEWNRSRTWIISRVDIVTPYRPALRLKHDHRHKDGTSDKVTMYGGDTATAGTGKRQEFPVDNESVSMFLKNGLQASVTNVWAVEVDDKAYTYELSRKNRLFRVTFDLTKPIASPPLPWGWGK